LKAIILAAGEGKRLRPLTNNKPKCMVELFGKSLLQWQIDTFKHFGISDISIVTGYHNKMIKLPNISYFHNEKYASTNMIETLFCAKSKLDDSVIVSYGDIIFEKEILSKLIKSNQSISVIIDKDWKNYWNMRFQNPLDDAESLLLDDNGFLTDIGQSVTSYEQIQGQYIGLMKFQNDGVTFLKDFYNKCKNESILSVNPLNPNLDFEKSYMTDLLRSMVINGSKIKSIPIHNGWLELDTFDDFKLYEKKFHENTLDDIFSVSS
jgi:L-glutamine-phosphate cytidylyltransferase